MDETLPQIWAHRKGGKSGGKSRLGATNPGGDGTSSLSLRVEICAVVALLF